MLKYLATWHLWSTMDNRYGKNSWHPGTLYPPNVIASYTYQLNSMILRASKQCCEIPWLQQNVRLVRMINYIESIHHIWWLFEIHLLTQPNWSFPPRFSRIKHIKTVGLRPMRSSEFLQRFGTWRFSSQTFTVSLRTCLAPGETNDRKGVCQNNVMELLA